MTTYSDSSITELLHGMQEGVSGAEDEVFRALYSRLRAMASAVRLRKGRDSSLEPTDLVHELYARVIRRDSPWSSRKHFMNWAALAMERMLIDRARARAARRGRERTSGERLADVAELGLLDEHIDKLEKSSGSLDRLGTALRALAQDDPQMCSMIRLHYWLGLDPEAIGPLVGISKRSVYRKIKFAKLRIKDSLE